MKLQLTEAFILYVMALNVNRKEREREQTIPVVEEMRTMSIINTAQYKLMHHFII